MVTFPVAGVTDLGQYQIILLGDRGVNDLAKVIAQ